MRQIAKSVSLLPLILILAMAVAEAIAQDPTGRPAGTPSGRRRLPAREKPKPAPEPITVILTVMTDPPQSDVYVNNERRGTTNAEGKLQINKLPLGYYTVEVKKEGFMSSTRQFNAGSESPTLVIKLTPALDDVVKEFDRLVADGKITAVDTPSAFVIFKDVAARFPDRPEVARMRKTLADRLSNRIAPVIPKTLSNWRDVDRDEVLGAIEVYETIAAINPEDKQARARESYLKGLIALRDWQMRTGSEQGQPGLETARAELEKSVKLEEFWAPGWLKLGQVLLLSGDAAGAEAAFAKTLQLEPKWSAVHCGLAAAYYERGKYKESIAASQKAIELDARHSEAYSRLGLAKAAKGEMSNGLKDVQRAIELDPTSALPHLHLGLIYSASKKDKELGRAEEELKRAVQMNPQNLEFSNQLAERALVDLQGRKKKRK